MTGQVLLLIRHAEKPEAAGAGGVDPGGLPDDRSLTPRGWARAGAWAELFRPSSGAPGMLPVPGAIFASVPAGHADGAGSRSRRPLETVTPLADKLGIAVDLRFAKGQEAALAAALQHAPAVTLVGWQHESIGAILAGLLAPGTFPAGWPDDRFNVVFRLTRPAPGAPWSFDQLAPLMLNGDQAGPI